MGGEVLLTLASNSPMFFLRCEYELTKNNSEIKLALSRGCPESKCLVQEGTGNNPENNNYLIGTT